VKVLCVFDSSVALADHQRGRLGEVESVFAVTAGQSYQLLGMGIWDDVLTFLIAGSDDLPMFLPAGLFQPASIALPSDWYFRLNVGIQLSGRSRWTEPCTALWGYRELVEDDLHAPALEEMQPHALRVFARRLSEASKQQ